MLKKHHRHSMEDCAKQVKLLTESLEQEHAACVEAEARVVSLEKVMEVRSGRAARRVGVLCVSRPSERCHTQEHERIAEDLRRALEKERNQAMVGAQQLRDVRSANSGRQEFAGLTYTVTAVRVPRPRSTTRLACLPAPPNHRNSIVRSGCCSSRVKTKRRA